MMRINISILLIVCFLGSCVEETSTVPIPVLHIEYGNEQALNGNLFGHFLEKCNWNGESGADIAWDYKLNKLREDVVRLIDSLKPPVVRFPGGTDVDYYQWTDLVDGAYDRVLVERPNYDGRSGRVVSQNEFGLDEFLGLSEQLKFEPLLVINIGDAYLNKISIEDAAEYAAALTAYCNASVENISLPKKYLKWAKLREKNGHKEPYGVKYFQIGNEVWLLDEAELGREKTIKPEIVDRYYRIVSNFISEIKSVDPQSQIIVEGNLIDFTKEAKKHLGTTFDLLAYHHYSPWGMNFAINEEGDTIRNISKEELYYATISAPDFNPITGESDIQDPVFRSLISQEIPIAMTEWNWNGWIGGDLKDQGHKESKLAQGLGAASYLHAMMRYAKSIKMGNQSMLVGNSWGINSVRIDKNTDEAMLFPTGLVTGLYADNHGSKVLASNLSQNNFYAQEYTISGINPQGRISYLDVVVSEGEDKLFLHVINRDYAKPRKLRLDIPNLNLYSMNVDHKELSGEVFALGEPETAFWQVNSSKLELNLQRPEIRIAPHSVNVFIFQKL